MLKVILRGHDNYYGLSDILRLFGGRVREDRQEGAVYCEADLDLEIISEVRPDGTTCAYVKDTNGEPEDLPAIAAKRSVKRDLYILLQKITGTGYPWGCLTGIRPTLVAAEEGDASSLTAKYLVRSDKAELAVRTSRREEEILAQHGEDTLNIYIGIPFCPSRCEYCSFISNDAVKHMKLLRPYEQALTDEIKMLAPLIGSRIASVYIGGGTPTVFDDGLFEELIGTVADLLPMDGDTEFTVEAGRPDTITVSKLKAMKRAGVQRICINPQTMNSETLAKLGRHHTAQDAVDAFLAAREEDFTDINMDLIAGLKYETDKDLLESARRVCELKPEDITLHTLYKKRRAVIERESVLARDRGDTDRAVSECYSIFEDNGYGPYYLYRQKDTGHGLENTGFTRGNGCYYNVAMMSDRRDVLSFGAGGMSKRMFGEGRLERCSCIKDVTGYIASFREMADKKAEFFGLNR